MWFIVLPTAIGKQATISQRPLSTVSSLRYLSGLAYNNPSSCQNNVIPATLFCVLLFQCIEQDNSKAARLIEAMVNVCNALDGSLVNLVLSDRRGGVA